MVKRIDSQLPHSARRKDGGSGIGDNDPGAWHAGRTPVVNSDWNIFESS
jgi:hypothetical protein